MSTLDSGFGIARSHPRRTAILVAAGRGVRAGGALPKQYRVLGGIPVLRRALLVLLDVPDLETRVAIHPADQALYRMAVDGLGEAGQRLGDPIAGAETRQATVLAALEALAADAPDIVAIHDAARPLLPPDVLRTALERLEAATHDLAGIVPVVPVADTLKKVTDGDVVGTVPRDGLYMVQTPQVFRFDVLLAAHRAARAAGRDDFTDDAALIEWQGRRVGTIPGDARNFKLTTPADFERAERMLAPGRAVISRVGIGYDVHAFGPGDCVWLGGVRIAHGRGVVAHSDGDVLLHALTDALLGTIGDGDIGTHFPPSDARWKGAASAAFVAHAAALVRARGGTLRHLDATLVAETPKLGPHRDAIRASIAAIAGLAVEAVSVKATTSERLGFTGRGEGLAALAVASADFEAMP